MVDGFSLERAGEEIPQPPEMTESKKPKFKLEKRPAEKDGIPLPPGIEDDGKGEVKASWWDEYSDAVVDKSTDLGIGMYVGLLDSVGGMAQKAAGLVGKVAPSTKKYTTEPLSRHVKSMDKRYEKTGGFGGIGRAAGNVAGYGGPLGGALKGLGAASGLAKTVAGRLLATAAGGSAQGFTVGGLSYDRSNPDAIFNNRGAATGAALGAAMNPAMQALPIIRSMNRSDELVKQAYTNIIKSISPKISAAPTRGAAEKIAIKTVKGMAHKIKAGEKKAWDSLMGEVKDKQLLMDTQSLLRSKVQTFKKDTAGDLPPKLNRWVDSKLGLEKPLRFGELKELRTQFRQQRDAAVKKLQTGDITRGAVNKTNELYNDITAALRETAGNAGRLDGFVAANTISKEANRFQGGLGMNLAKVATNNATAAKFINKVVGGNSAAGVKENLQLLGGGSARAVRAQALKEVAVKSLNKDGSFNLTSFFNNTQRSMTSEALVEGTPQLKMMQGLNKALDDLNKSGSLNLGPAANFSPVWHLGNKFLGHLSTPKSQSLRKQLVKYGLLEKNEKLKKLMGNRISERLLRTGIVKTPGPEGGHTLDIKRRDK